MAIYFEDKKPIYLDGSFIPECPNIELGSYSVKTEYAKKAKENILALKTEIKSEFPNAVFYQLNRRIIIFDGSKYSYFKVSAIGEVKKSEVCDEFRLNFAEEQKKYQIIPENNQIVQYKPSFWGRLRNRIFGRRSTNNQIQESNDNKKMKSAKQRRIEMVEGIHMEESNGTSNVERQSITEEHEHNKGEGRTEI